jgi:hypothetical protein
VGTVVCVVAPAKRRSGAASRVGYRGFGASNANTPHAALKRDLPPGETELQSTFFASVSTEGRGGIALSTLSGGSCSNRRRRKTGVYSGRRWFEETLAL